MIFAQERLGVEIFSPLGILILVIGVNSNVGLPFLMIKYGKKDYITTEFHLCKDLTHIPPPNF